jgi:hypothetical protein
MKNRDACHYKRFPGHHETLKSDIRCHNSLCGSIPITDVLSKSTHH